MSLVYDYETELKIGIMENLKNRDSLQDRLLNGLFRVPFLCLTKEEVTKAIDMGLLDSEKCIIKKIGIQESYGCNTTDIVALEKEIYTDNPDLCKPEWKHELILFACDVLSIARGYPKLSFLHRDNSGKLDGYITAYEGVRNSKRIIYITDWMTTKDSKSVGGRLMVHFLTVYAKEYISKGILLPIFANARANTSREIVISNLDLLANIVNRNLSDKNKAIYFKVNYNQKRLEAGEVFYDTVFAPCHVIKS